MTSSAPKKEESSELFQAEDRRSWRAWLEKNHKTARGVWLVFSKKRASRPSLSYNEAVEEALAFGWIDSRGKRLDAERTMLMMSPRKPKSPWAKVNKDRVERLIESGLMAPAGMEKVEAAKRDGSWNMLDGVAELWFPSDLKKALAANGKARAWFESSGRTYKRLALQWIATARRPETRAKRISEVVRLAARGRKAGWYAPKQKRPAGESQGATPSSKRKS